MVERRRGQEDGNRTWIRHAPHAHDHHVSTDDAGQHDIHTTLGRHDASAGHDKHAGHSVEMFRQKFWGTLLLSTEVSGRM